LNKNQVEHVKELALAFKALEESEYGNVVLDHLSWLCGEHRSCFDENNERLTTFNEGKRYVMLNIRKNINGNIEAMNAQISKQKEEERTRNERNRNY
jgi:lipopolysaccharide biosynthesis glycosyltransferase